MNNKKKVSVIVPCYNSGQWIKRCIESLFSQTMSSDEIEVILVDDCSTDDTWTNLCALEKSYPSDSIIVIQSDEHLGPGGARNLALSYARANYVAMVDSDDWVEPEFLEKMYEVAISNECDIVCCNVYRDYGDGRMLPIEYHKKSQLIRIDDLKTRKEILVKGSLKGRMLLRKKYLLDNHIFYPDGIVYEDICWNALNYCYMKRLYVLQEFLYHYFVNPTSVVLMKDQGYTRDMFTTNYIKLNELVNRGFYELMPEEIEFDMLISYYLMILKMYKLRSNIIDKEGFYEMQCFILHNFTRYKENPYIDNLLTECQKELLGLIDKPMQEKELQMLHDVLEKMDDL